MSRHARSALDPERFASRHALPTAHEHSREVRIHREVPALVEHPNVAATDSFAPHSAVAVM